MIGSISVMHYYGDEMKKNMVGGVWKDTRFWSENLKGIGHLEDQGIDGR